MNSIVVGGHYGDEGKGKMVSYLALKDDPRIIARAGVGPNAGHTVYKDGKKYGLRMITCGFVNAKSKLLVGAGVLVDPRRFLDEIELTETRGRAFLDRRCTVIDERHRKLDASGNSKKIGTTGSGCGPANADRVNRVARRAEDFPELKDYLTDVPLTVNDAIKDGKDVLIEGTQGFGLSVYYGNYPYVTSKDTSASTAAADVGIGPTKIDEVYVVYKAYMSRVGEDPYVKYLSDDDVKKSRMWSRILKAAQEADSPGQNANERIAHFLGEKGTVTGRPRKIADFDFKLARYSVMVNGATKVIVTCIDKLFPECQGIRDYDKLSEAAREYLDKLEEELGVDVSLISTGPDVFDVVDLR
ncbi:MAG: adenylosuccinate synthetase [Candidatus Altiarchaeota archaeon]